MKLKKDAVLKFLRENPIMNIAVADDNKPMASVLLFHVDDEMNFFVGTRKDSYKAKALKKNPKLSFSVWKHGEMLVQSDAVVNLVLEKEIDKKLDSIVESVLKIDDFWPPVLSISGDDYILFKIKPKWMKVLDLSNLKIKESGTPFTEFQWE